MAFLDGIGQPEGGEPGWGWILGGIVGIVGFAFLTRPRNADLGRMPAGWWNRKSPSAKRLCYERKTDAMNAFKEANRGVIDNYGGESIRVSPSEFDAVNHKYDLTGKKAARTVAEAMWASLRSDRSPYCLTDIDLDALNDTSPARESDQPFRLPDWAEEKRLLREQTELFREQAEEAGEDFPSGDCCRVCWSSQPCGNGCISKKKTCRKEGGCAGDDIVCPI